MNDVPVAEPQNPPDAERTARLNRTRAIDEALSTLRRWADLENAKGLVLDRCDASPRGPNSSLVATKLRQLVLALRKERVRQLWNTKTELAKVEQDLQALVSLDPTDFNSHFDHASVLRRLANVDGLAVNQRRDYLEKARRSYQNAKGLASTSTEKLRTSEYLSVVFRSLGLRSKGRQESAAALAIKPDGPEAWIHLGFQLTEMREFDRAAQACSQVIDLSRPGGAAPNPLYFAYGFRERSYAYRELGQFDRAIKDLDESVKNGATLSEVGEYRAWVYLRKGQLDEALSACKNRIEGTGDKATSYLYRGKIKRCLGIPRMPSTTLRWLQPGERLSATVKSFGRRTLA